MRTQPQRRRTTVAIVLLALAAAAVLWVAFTMDSKGNSGIALDGSGSGSVKSGFVGSGSVGTGSAESGSTGSGSTGSGSTGSDSSKSDSPKAQTDHSSSTVSSTTDSGSTGSGATSSTSSGSTSSGSTSSNRNNAGTGTTGPGNTSSGSPGSSHGSGAHASDHGNGNGNGGGGHTDPPLHTTGLSVSIGTVGALFPGARTTAPVTVANQMTDELALTEIRVSSPGAAGCGTTNLYLGHRTLEPHLTIPGHGQVSPRVRFGLRASAPDSCKGKTIPFSVTVRAVTR